MPFLHLPFGVVTAYSFFISQLTCHFLTQGISETPLLNLVKPGDDTLSDYLYPSFMVLYMCMYYNTIYAHLSQDCKLLDYRGQFLFHSQWYLQGLAHSRCSTNIKGVNALWRKRPLIRSGRSDQRVFHAKRIAHAPVQAKLRER